MIDGYINISEAAEKWGISTRRVQVLCKNGRIEGAAKLGREWAIPATAEKPGDDRFVNGKYVAWRKKSLKIRETNTGIKGNQDKLDKWDYAISISSGAKQHHLRDFTHHPTIVG